MELGVGSADKAGQKRIYQQYHDTGSSAYKTLLANPGNPWLIRIVTLLRL